MSGSSSSRDCCPPGLARTPTWGEPVDPQQGLFVVGPAKTGPAPSPFPPMIRKKTRASFPRKVPSGKSYHTSDGSLASAPGHGPAAFLWATSCQVPCAFGNCTVWEAVARTPSVSWSPGLDRKDLGLRQHWLQPAAWPCWEDSGTVCPQPACGPAGLCLLGCPITKVKALASFPRWSSTLTDSGSCSRGDTGR